MSLDNNLQLQGLKGRMGNYGPRGPPGWKFRRVVFNSKRNLLHLGDITYGTKGVQGDKGLPGDPGTFEFKSIIYINA